MLSREELLHHYPSRYEDLREYERGVVVGAINIFTRSGKTVQKISVRLGNKIRELTYFNQPFLVKTLRPGVPISLAGNEYEVNGPLIHTGRLVPVYPEIRGISTKMLRRQIYNQLKKSVNDWLPGEIKKQYGLIALQPALQKIHFPESAKDAAIAKKRLAFDEMLRLQLNALKRKQAARSPQGYKLLIDRQAIYKLIDRLPFTLTGSQNQAVGEILDDLSSGRPMNRLLTGEVGSGKTVVAAVALYAAYLNKLKAVLMAPTEILAHQHYQTLKILPVKIGLVTKSIKEQGEILVGTHALLNRQIKRLGLVVIDEQQRFGVNQRAKLLETKPVPHLLTLTATPIPRTMALTAYAHLDLSQIERRPQQQSAKTWLVPDRKRAAAYDWIKKQIKTEQSQVFVVCPLINPSEKETMQDIKDITSEFARLRQIFAGFSLDLLHGRLKSAQKNQIIKKFSQHKTQILVATPVIEVGIDIPQAAIIVVENAERFGLAQLHQLRGRVGRRGQTGYCLLFSAKANRRLKTLETINDGLKLAELDLKLRGPGEIYGTAQHGFIKLKLADPFDLNLIALTRKAAAAIISLPCRPSQNEKSLPDAGANAAPPLN